MPVFVVDAATLYRSTLRSTLVRPPMEPSVEQLTALALRAQAFFSDKSASESLPFVHRYPVGSCEVVSALVALALQREYEEAQVQVAMGYNHSKDAWHFWVEVGGTVVDATAHQFPHFQGPLVTSRPNPLEVDFPDIERLAPQNAIGRLTTVSSKAAEATVRALLKS